MTWTALPPIPQHDLRWGRKENENEPGHDDPIGYREVYFSRARVDAARQSVLRQRLSRSRVLEFFGKLPRCLAGLEACASSHYRARELIKLGHEVKVMPAQMLAAQLEGVKGLADHRQRPSNGGWAPSAGGASHRRPKNPC
jgi:hypothetical protein